PTSAWISPRFKPSDTPRSAIVAPYDLVKPRTHNAGSATDRTASTAIAIGSESGILLKSEWGIVVTLLACAMPLSLNEPSPKRAAHWRLPGAVAAMSLGRR